MMEVYRPDWCEKREDWSIYLFSPHNKYVFPERSFCLNLFNGSDGPNDESKSPSLLY